MADELLKSNMKLMDIDAKELGTYIALNMKPAEIRLAGL